MKRRGIVKGQTIEFDHPLGLPDGQAVELDIRPLADKNEASPAARADQEPADWRGAVESGRNQGKNPQRARWGA